MQRIIAGNKIFPFGAIHPVGPRKQRRSRSSRNRHVDFSVSFAVTSVVNHGLFRNLQLGGLRHGDFVGRGHPGFHIGHFRTIFSRPHIIENVLVRVGDQHTVFIPPITHIAYVRAFYLHFKHPVRSVVTTDTLREFDLGDKRFIQVFDLKKGIGKAKVLIFYHKIHTRGLRAQRVTEEKCFLRLFGRVVIVFVGRCAAPAGILVQKGFPVVRVFVHAVHGINPAHVFLARRNEHFFGLGEIDAEIPRRAGRR